MRLFIHLSYDGSAYNGWQRQQNAPSVQAQVERALSVYFREDIGITGAGRTDAGVHAVNYTAHFDLRDDLLQEQQQLLYKINAILPKDIVIYDIYPVEPGSHARFDALSRTYKYFIHTIKDPFSERYSYFFPYQLDMEAMNRGAAFLLGEKEFTSMAKLHSGTKNNICTISQAYWSYEALILHRYFPLQSDKHIVLTITANRFLRNMVRAIVGSLLEVGRGLHKPEWIVDLLEEKERGAAGNSVPAHALFLTDIVYPSNIKNCIFVKN